MIKRSKTESKDKERTFVLLREHRRLVEVHSKCSFLFFAALILIYCIQYAMHYVVTSLDFESLFLYTYLTMKKL